MNDNLMTGVVEPLAIVDKSIYVSFEPYSLYCQDPIYFIITSFSLN